MKPNMLYCVVATALLLAPGAAAWAGGQTAAPADSDNPKIDAAKDQKVEAKPKAPAKNLQAMQVTGSLIPRPQIEGPSPVTTVTAKDIEQQGFGDVYQALRALPQANGAIQDGQFTGGFTPGAKEISLFGLSPDFTLTLLNGRPMASYPLAFNGSTNITDIANIPVGLIDHIDVLTGGQSSIYGSAAIAGVVNIVLKDHIEGTHMAFRYGDYSDGGGANKRFQFSSGHTWGKLDVSGGIQLSKEDPIYAFQRSYINSNADDPTGKNAAASRTFLREVTGDNAHYIDPGAAACAPLSYLYKGSTGYDFRPGSNLGNYCGSPNNVGYASISNRETDANGTLFLRYHINDHTELYSDILYSYSNPTYTGGSPSWNQTFYNKNTGQYEEWQRIFAPEEVGLDSQDQHVFTRSYNAAFGIRGSFGDSDWNYDAYYNRSQTDLTRKSTDFLANNGVDQYYLGSKLGVDASGIPIYAPNLDRLYQPITPALFNQFTATDTSNSQSWVQNETVTVNNTNLFSLPAGDVGFASVLQSSNQRFSNRSDSPLADEGYYRGVGGSTVAAGSSNQFAFGTELQVPLLKQLTANISARVDKYRYGGAGHGKGTYKLGLEYRPLDNLLLRASYATAFRAPDMFYLFSSKSSGYSTVTDYARCRPEYNSQTYSSCPYTDQSILAVTSGNTGLKDITAKTFTYGFVWSTDDNRLSWSVDYNAIRIANEVVTLSTDEILQQEANCKLGVSENGDVPYDINSPTCKQVIGEVQRYPASNPVQGGAIEQVSTYPINVANEYQTGIQSTLNYRLNAGWLGTFLFSGNYYDELKHTYKEKAGDTTLNYLCCDNSDEFKSRVTGTVTWNIGKWSSTLYGIRDGSTWNSIGTKQNIGPWITFNGSVGYKVNTQTSVSFVVNNIANKRPPVDITNDSWPYYDQGQYNALGRAMYLEFGYDFK